jgi:acetyl esterase/lipase
VPIDPFLAEKLPLLDGLTDFAAAFEDPSQRARLDEFMSSAPGYDAPPIDTVDTEVQGRHGLIRIRIYRRPASDTTSHPGLLWMHGGGFVFGDLDMPEADSVSRELAHRADAVVISVDYHLAIDGVHFPVPHDDVMDVWRWAQANAVELGIDPERISIGGASAGGNLAAGAGLHIRDDGDLPQPAGLLLAYPVLHGVVPPASEELEAKIVEVPPVLRFPPDVRAGLNSNYLGGPVTDAPAYAMPANGDLAGLPPVRVLTCEYDDLRASGEPFADQLRAAGVPTHARVELGMFHGHLNYQPSLGAVDDSLEFLAEGLRRH